MHHLCHEDLTKIMDIHQNSTLIAKKDIQHFILVHKAQLSILILRRNHFLFFTDSLLFFFI